MTQIFIVLLILMQSLVADIKSTTGRIKFDTQMDGQPEMTLNSTGLGIGITPSTNLHVNGNAAISNKLFVGGSAGSSNLNINGTIGFGFQTVSSNTDLREHSIVLADSSSDNITLTLPYAGNVTGRQYEIKKISPSNSVWISGGGNLIDDVSPIELPESSNLASVKLISDGRQWYKIDQKDLSDTVASSNLVGWWKLDETSGTVALDSSGQGNDGTYIVSSDNLGVDGIISKALDIDTSTSYVSISNSNDPTDQLSVSVWVNLDRHKNWSHFVDRGWIATNNWLVYAPSSGLPTFSIYDGASQTTAQSSTAMSLNTWYHIVATYDGSNMRIYVNGDLQDTTAISITLNTGPIRLSNTGASAYLDGKIDDARLYNKTLTASEVRALYDQGQ